VKKTAETKTLGSKEKHGIEGALAPQNRSKRGGVQKSRLTGEGQVGVLPRWKKEKPNQVQWRGMDEGWQCPTWETTSNTGGERYWTGAKQEASGGWKLTNGQKETVKKTGTLGGTAMAGNFVN